MQPYLASLFRIQHADEDVQRRGRNAVLAALGMIVVVLLSVPLTLDGPDWWIVFAAEVVCIVLFCAMIVLARRGAVTAAALGMGTTITVIVLGTALPRQELGIGVFYFIVGILIAGITLRPWAIWLTLAINLAALGVLGGVLSLGLMAQPATGGILFTSAFLCGFSALISALGASSTERMLRALQQARAASEQAAAALEQANQQLEQRVAERTADLAQATAEAQQARAAAEQASTLKSQFLANMSHELRTPLNSIINFTRILSTGMRGPINDGQLDYLNRVRHSGEHLLGLINDILDLSKIEAGRMELCTEPLQIADLVQSVMATAAGLTKDKSIELIADVAPNLPPIDADRTRIRQVLLNLLSNAAKFTEAGTIVVRAIREGDQIILRVADTGIGIAAEDLIRIFEEFQQVDGESNRRYEGTGLGLAICRRLIELHGGRIWVESMPGAGSTFSFSLPITDTTPTGVPAEPIMELPTTNPMGDVVLIIDDDPAAIEIASVYLRHADYAVYGVTDSRRALDEARRLRPKVIILDVLMPHKDGWEVLADLKSDADLRGIPVALYTILEEQKLGFYLGASAYLTKPINAEHLCTTVTQLVSSGATVMVIDDDPNTREIVTHQLAQGGSYQLVTASGGREGLERIAEARPDLIILDLMMPEIDGFAVLEHLDQHTATRSIPVIVMTAKDLSKDERDFLNQRVSGLLTKGTQTPEQLLGKVADALGIAPMQLIVD